VLVDAAAGTKQPAFDHERLAASLSASMTGSYGATTLPFTSLTFEGDGAQIRFVAEGSQWRCDTSAYGCVDIGPPPAGGRGGRGGGPPPVPAAASGLLRPSNQLADPAILGALPVIDDYRVRMDNPGEAPFEDGWGNGEDVLEVLARQQAGAGRAASEVESSPDGRWEAYILNHNVYMRTAGSDDDDGVALSFDGSEGDFYTRQSIAWSPDSRRLVAYRTRPGYRREVRYVISSPTDQLQPRDSVQFYRKPGDVLDRRQPVLFDVASRTAIEIDDALFPNAYNTSPARWWEDSRAFTFEYNQRGHQAYRVIEVDGQTGEARALIDEQAGPHSFIHYSGGNYRYDAGDGNEIIWASERDAWRHLYLYDGRTGQVKNRITQGDWVVRGVERVDEENRQIWFTAGGMIPGQDPYFVHYYRIDFDGTGLVALTEADGEHEVAWSPSGEYYVDRWSRVDLATVAELRRTRDRSLVMELERGDLTALEEAGWTRPEVFSAKGRDGVTDIWGMIVRPTTFDPSRKYPVVEYIYAGPHSFHTPKAFSVNSAMRNLAELGFIVVQLDGMGTTGRSKAFHDVAWKNLGDAGFPDRIRWHQAVAARYPWYDITRVGIYGGSAGGQNAMGALLFHPDFYAVAVSFAGCHDNRMDKIWWNEQWMGWPLDRGYIESSNMESAHLLQGRLLLIWGELDTNVDPSSSMQVVNALIRADKYFDMLIIPGGDHGAGRRGPTAPYGDLKRNDFFVKHLLGVEPPDRNLVSAQEPGGN
jgi:dipeptidyl aminopeptidase/acylaminoacyl peptidase